MTDVMAIMSKAIFEKTAGKAPRLGTQLGVDRYVSANKGLQPLTGGGRLFVVTVRPPDEALWLVAVLDQPRFTGAEWVAAACATPLTDITPLKARLVFDSGKGLPTTPGTLGMSLQTPRVLTAADRELLVDALAGAPSAGATPSAAVAKPAAPVDPAQALRAAVLAAPHDDAARRAFAAHARAAGDPRGELVEVELALRDRLSIPQRKRLRARRAALLAAHATQWWPWPFEHTTRGGFVRAVVAEDAAAWLSHAAAVMAREPVVDLELVELDEDIVAELAKAPWLARIESLVLRGPIGDDGFAALCKSKQLGALRRLNVASNEISGDGLAALTTAFPGLDTLVLTGNELGDDGAAALARWKSLAQVRVLYLTACGLGADGLRAIAAALLAAGPARLEKLTLARNELGDAGAAALATAGPALPRLAYLELLDSEIGKAGIAALDQARLSDVRHFDL